MSDTATTGQPALPYADSHRADTDQLTIADALDAGTRSELYAVAGHLVATDRAACTCAAVYLDSALHTEGCARS